MADALEDSATQAGWDEEWKQHHLRTAMAAIAAEFNEADCKAFRLYAIQGQGARETAEMLGMTVEQAYQAKSRILKRLTQLVDEQVRDEG